MKKTILYIFALLLLIIATVCGSYYIVSKRHQETIDTNSETKYKGEYIIND